MKLRRWAIAGVVVGLIAIGSTAITVGEPDTDSTAQASSCTTSQSATTLSGVNNQAKVYNFLTTTHDLSSIAAAAVEGNFMAESGVNIDPTAQQNDHPEDKGIPYPIDGVGFGIAQWTFTSRQQPLVDLADTEHARDPTLSVTSLSVQLDYVWQELSTTYQATLTSLRQDTTVEAATSDFFYQYEAGDASSLPKRISNAQGILASSQVMSGTVTTASNVDPCSSGVDVYGTQMAQIALKLSWPDGSHGLTATPDYLSYLQQYDAGGYVPYHGADCGSFTATVIHASGADPNFPNSGTAVQEPYMLAHATSPTATSKVRYQQIPNLGNPSNLLPGDIFIIDTHNPQVSGHTYIYTGMQPNGTDMAEASQLTDQPYQSHVFFSDFRGQFRIYRIVQ